MSQTPNPCSSTHFCKLQSWVKSGYLSPKLVLIFQNISKNISKAEYIQTAQILDDRDEVHSMLGACSALVFVKLTTRTCDDTTVNHVVKAVLDISLVL